MGFARGRRIGRWLVAVAGPYLVVRGIAELFVVGWGSPASYRHDWGGPSLAGVLVVHCGPGVFALAAAGLWLARRRRGSEIVDR